MNRETYIRLMDWGNADQKRIRGIYLLNQLVTYIIYIAYPALALYLFMERDKRLWKIVLVPGVSFLLVSVFRAVYDEKRPYVAFDYKPVIQKEKKGKAMPSRHVFSAMILSAAFFYIVPASGIFMFVCALLMCVGRVLAGVHYPKDVLVGALLGLGMGLVGFYVL